MAQARLPVQMGSWLIKTFSCVFDMEKQAVTNFGAAVPKKYIFTTSAQSYLDSSRSIHMYPAFTQAFGKACTYMRGERQVHDDEFGAVRGRRREEGICVQLHTQHRAQANHMSWLTNMYDVKNAFYCVTTDMLRQWWHSVDNAFISNMYKQILHQPVCLMQCADTHLFLQARGSVPPGLFCATEVFNSAYRVALHDYHDQARGICNLVQARSLINPEQYVDAAHTKFVDDVATTI
eukprot:7626610-Karenia_brevis.AAC.1